MKCVIIRVLNTLMKDTFKHKKMYQFEELYNLNIKQIMNY